MTKERVIYYRRKGKEIVVEGRRDGKTEYLFKLPNPEKLLIPSLFTAEKIEKIKQKIARLDYREKKLKKSSN